MANDPDRERLDALAERIRRAETEAGIKPPETKDDNSSQESVRAGNIVADFIATILASAVLGWLVDKMLGTLPWGALIMLLFGFASGIMNVWRKLNVKSRAENGRGLDKKEE